MLEFPDSVSLDEDEYIYVSKAGKKKRYITQSLEDINEELEAAEAVLHDSMIPFLRNMFGRFYQYRSVFSNAASCIGELDCLCALADVSSDTSSGPMCKPEILDAKVEGRQVLELI